MGRPPTPEGPPVGLPLDSAARTPTRAAVVRPVGDPPNERSLKMKQHLALPAVAALVLASGFVPLAAQATGPGDQITICHATGSSTNPYVVLTIPRNGLNGHAGHEGDIIPATDECIAQGGGRPDEVPAPAPSTRPNEGSEMGGDLPPEALPPVPAPTSDAPAPADPAPVLSPDAPVQPSSPSPAAPAPLPEAALPDSPATSPALLSADRPADRPAPEAQQVTAYPVGGADTGVSMK